MDIFLHNEKCFTTQQAPPRLVEVPIYSYTEVHQYNASWRIPFFELDIIHLIYEVSFEWYVDYNIMWAMYSLLVSIVLTPKNQL